MNRQPVTQKERRTAAVEHEVLRRYGEGAEQLEPNLCCPIEYDSRYLDIIPREIVEKDYGCGDPSKHVRQGETVLDLGSGGGKICYILSQRVGAQGRVIGVDFNDKMLSLARKYQAEMAEKIGYANVEFRKGMIQDLALNLDRLQDWLDANPVDTVEGTHALEAERVRLRAEEPLVEDAAVDVIVSNCVLNLVSNDKKKQLFMEMARVLRPGGRALISDIVCDEDPPPEMRIDPELWSGCIAGAFREDVFLTMFEQAGFHGIRILVREEQPWQTIHGIEFRSMTVEATRIDHGKELDCNQAAVYRGPWKKVQDDFGNVYFRGERVAVSDRQYSRLIRADGPYAGALLAVDPHQPVTGDQARQFRNGETRLRHPRETKGAEYRITTQSEDSCCGGGSTSCC
jgi:SAM-dependent methyltransferase